MCDEKATNNGRAMDNPRLFDKMVAMVEAKREGRMDDDHAIEQEVVQKLTEDDGPPRREYRVIDNAHDAVYGLLLAHDARHVKSLPTDEERHELASLIVAVLTGHEVEWRRGALHIVDDPRDGMSCKEFRATVGLAVAECEDASGTRLDPDGKATDGDGQKRAAPYQIWT